MDQCAHAADDQHHGDTQRIYAELPGNFQIGRGYANPGIEQRRIDNGGRKIVGLQAKEKQNRDHKGAGAGRHRDDADADFAKSLADEQIDYQTRQRQKDHQRDCGKYVLHKRLALEFMQVVDTDALLGAVNCHD